MYNISEEEIDFILDDITKKGIVTEDVRDNILDHVCCIIENGLSCKEEFSVFYLNTIAQFYKKELCEIEQETKDLLTFKYFYAMKRTLKITGLISVVLILLGAILKTFHSPGAGLSLVLGFTIFSFIFIPLNIILTFKDDQKISNRIVMTLGMGLTLTGTIGLLFKVMHWPFANILFMSSLFAFGLVFIPLYFFTRSRNPETKFNAIINTTFMIAAAGMLFAMVNLGYSKTPDNEVVITQESLMAQLKTTNEQLTKINQEKEPSFISLNKALLDEIEKLKINSEEVFNQRKVEE